MSAITEAVRRYVDTYPDMDASEAAEAIVAGLSRAEIREAAVLWVRLAYETEERREIRTVEKKAAAPRGYEYDGKGQLVATRVRQQRRRVETEAEWARKARVAAGEEPARSVEDQEAAEQFAAARRAAAEAARQEQERHEAFVARIKSEARMEWTAELLASTFAVGDGTRVTWADATVNQHEQRIALLARGIGGSIDTMKRHEAAVADILAAAAHTLGEIA